MELRFPRASGRRYIVSRRERILHIDLCCCISSDHVLDHKTTAWMSIFPRVQPKHRILVDDDKIAGGDEAFDLIASKDPLLHARSLECTNGLEAGKKHDGIDA